jgi:Tfp pilus assembly protein PilF
MRLKQVVSANHETSPVCPVAGLTSTFQAVRSRRRAPLVGAALLVIGCAGQAKPPASGAEPALETRIEEPRKTPPRSPLVKEAETLLQKGEVEAARAKFAEAIAAQPEDARAYLGLGLCDEALEKFDSAEQAYRKAAEVDPSLAEAHNNLGVLLRDKGELDPAIEELSRASELDPKLTSARINLAMTLEDAGRTAEADAAYKEAVRLSPQDGMLRANYGLFLLKQNDNDAAANELLAGLDQAKGDRAALLAIGNGLRRAKKPDAAVRALHQAIAAGDGRPTPALLAELSLAQNAAGDAIAAKASLDEALLLDPKYATGHYLLASVLAGEGNFKGAVAHYKRCIELDPKSDLAARAREKLAAAKHESKHH